MIENRSNLPPISGGNRTSNKSDDTPKPFDPLGNKVKELVNSSDDEMRTWLYKLIMYDNDGGACIVDKFTEGVDAFYIIRDIVNEEHPAEKFDKRVSETLVTILEKYDLTQKDYAIRNFREIADKIRADEYVPTIYSMFDKL